MPFCANCGWKYDGTPRFCRECGRQLFRSPAPHVHLHVVESEQPPTFDPRLVAVCAGLALVAGVALMSAGAAGSPVASVALPLDEAWTRLVYARALAQGGRPEFTAGLPAAGVGSLLWVGLLALLIKTLGALGVGVVGMAKALSLLAGATTAGLASELARRISGSRVAALAVGAAVALDPSLAFASASGIETTLFAALLLGSVLAYHSGRSLLCGALLALLVLARAEGIAVAVLIGAAGAWNTFAAFRRGDFAPRTEADLDDADDIALPDSTDAPEASWDDADSERELEEPAPRRLALPRLPVIRLPRSAAAGLAAALPIVAALLWSPVAGPSRLLPRGENGALHLLPDPIALWLGYVDPWVGLVGAGAWIVALPVVVLGARGLWRTLGVCALPLLGFPIVLLVWNAAAMAGNRVPWEPAARQRLDPLLPLLALAFVFGLRELWWSAGPIWERRFPVGSPWRRGWAVGVVAAGVLAACVPFAAQVGLWMQVPTEYLRAARELDETYFALAVEARASVPEQSLIAAVEPGALRYVSRRPVADLTGTNTPSLAGHEPAEALLEARPEFAALPLGPAFESVPGTTLLRAFPPGAEPGRGVGLFRVGAAGAPAPRDTPLAFPVDGLRRLDYLDVANDASERAHNYQAAVAGPTVRRLSRVNAQQAVEDDGRPLSSGETFELAVEPGKDVILARRYDGTQPGAFRIAVDAQPAGEWQPRSGRYVIAEETIRIPAGLIRRPKATISLQPTTPSSGRTISFAYWTFADR